MWKEFVELRQTPRLLVLIIIAPILQLTLLGYAATTDVRNVPIVVVDQDHSQRSRQLIEKCVGSPFFNVIAEEPGVAAIDDDLAQGRAWLALVIPAGFGDATTRVVTTSQAQSLGAQAPSPTPQASIVQLIADGTDANSSGVAMAYASALISEFGGTVAAESGVRVASIEGRIRVWFNPQLESRVFMLPGLIAVLLLVITTSLSSMAIVRERELGTLEQLNVTPLSRTELILGKLLPYGMVGVFDVLLVIMVVVLWFQVPLRGSAVLLVGASLVYFLCTFALGLFVSTISHTQQQAMMTATFFFLVPMMYLSGFVFPIENMPKVIQWVTTVIPLRYFLIIVRGIFLKGIGFRVLWPQFVALGTWGVTVLTLATLRSHKRD